MFWSRAEMEVPLEGAGSSSVNNGLAKVAVESKTVYRMVLREYCIFAIALLLCQRLAGASNE